MDRIRIRGGRALAGTIPISGAKNAALPLMASALLTDGPLTLTNAPDLADVTTMAGLLAQHGLSVTRDKAARTITLSGTATNLEAPYDLVRKMRASVLVLGPLLARHGRARVSLPGGCAIGTRPVDLHLKALEQMGAAIEITGGYIEATAPGRLKAARIIFPQVSVGATENILMASALAKGTTEIVNAAREPEITDLAACLMRMGARIEGLGTDRLLVEGVESLGAAVHPIIPDRIEAGTYACAAAITGGSVLLAGARLDHLGAVTRILRDAGVDVAEAEGGLKVARLNGLRGTDVMTEPFPGFATDMQAQFMALMCVAEGAAMITETIFENRFMHVPELLRMGARINFHGASAIVRGVPRLSGAPVMATDLRASVSLILAGLAAQGETIVNRVYHLDRGYEHVEEKLAAVGADIERLPG
ncbi:UDP-N-acetylglucosamine 1-carboxyvinyltransferase [Roseomonas alkaliterrae]|uniref:UDP-N-acetylglucosamine 1-carboxyvinyltransferase n=1 Tax=Neoroseomonas alkaliterrae TaxID=1452450 RepID=A0A840XVD3_9PROT|nr:UDP-N-acetylglucosamine 1-carboxyvinyltransferase [Neoroseomonas alkaliterrae]MBB5690599.1 UDP-N-acetylglucosamine 1-carboxyvinyltransferase [Neoroseomonas alkaliterrae]MBR0677557.1 UDP-N-acetylglucosamine 1-carboxyvinyltransferase [Neoroseomonas alkaliterrae]